MPRVPISSVVVIATGLVIAAHSWVGMCHSRAMQRWDTQMIEYDRRQMEEPPPDGTMESALRRLAANQEYSRLQVARADIAETYYLRECWASVATAFVLLGIGVSALVIERKWRRQTAQVGENVNPTPTGSSA